MGIIMATKYTYKRQLEERLGIPSHSGIDGDNTHSIIIGDYWDPNSVFIKLLDCEYNSEFDGILAHCLINGTVYWLGQRLDPTDTNGFFLIGPDCWELLDGKMASTVEKPISQEVFDKAICLAADELNISIL